MSALARESVLKRGGAAYRALTREGNLTLVTVLKVLAALGLRLTIAPLAAGADHDDT
ncbi:hypothetical protein LMG23994_00319 [Cupriavidus pinatubonensis]|uniref:Transcriptional regulator n=2 Tax=Cupriavidus pinatubonensis TaxID=248026 RepID=A0ABM8W9K3_9BURK|nr:hypothetical protein LMG23994_00319 [Cupriavidus pinatubonensis]